VEEIRKSAAKIGLFLGLTTLHFCNKYLPRSDFFVNPEVDIRIAIIATIILIISGAIAGFVPAYRAAIVKPIEALKED
jgi:putative ABC transport system permease protein